MAKIYIRPIQSSSKNNCIVLFDGATHLFLDYGSSPQLVRNYTSVYNCDYKDFAGILLTHYHSDHINGLNDKNIQNINVYATLPTINFIKKKQTNTLNNEIKALNKWVKIPNSNWSFKAIKTIHNAQGSVCFIVKNKFKKLLYLTDTEYFENKNFKNLDAYIVEANYGSEIVTNTSRESKHLTSVVNHMNLDQSYQIYHKYQGFKTKLFLFSHLSITSISNSFLKTFLKTSNNKELDFIDPKIAIPKKQFSY